MALPALKQWLCHPWNAIAIAFSVPFFLRLLPQLAAATSVPIGYDTIAGYAPFARLVQQHGLGKEAFLLLQRHMAPLLWLLVGSLATTGIHPFTLMQILPPFLYGGLGVALQHFARRGLGWNPPAAVGAALLTLGYFLPLRYGWDNLKDVAGLALLFMALAEVPRFATVRGRLLFALFAVASVLTEEVEAVLLGGIAAVMFLRGLRRRQYDIAWFVVGVACVALVLFYSGLVGPKGAGPFPPYGLPGPSSPNPPFLQGIVEYPSWIAKASGAGLLITLGLAPLAYPALKGLIRSPITDAWIVTAAVGTFGIFFIPEGVFPVWPTWLVLLSFPLGLSASRGLLHINRRDAVAVLSVFAILSGGFVVLPADHALPYFTSPETRWYVPTSMVQTAIPLDRVVGVEATVAWLDAHVTEEDWIVVSDVFAGFVMVLGNATRLYPYHHVGWINWSLFIGSDTLYTIYWADPNDSWFAGGAPPKAFRETFAREGVAVLAAEVQQLVQLEEPAETLDGYLASCNER